MGLVLLLLLLGLSGVGRSTPPTPLPSSDGRRRFGGLVVDDETVGGDLDGQVNPGPICWICGGANNGHQH
jgi:hypothetical protein